jgi:F-type H+-transporting ATPase subunit b
MTYATKFTYSLVLLSGFLTATLAHAEEAVTSAASEVADVAVAHTEAHSSGGLPQFDPSSWPSQIFWLAIFFVITYAFFAKAILPSIGGTMASRQKHIDDHLAAAETLSAEAAKLRAEVDAGLKDAAAKASQSVAAVDAAAKNASSKSLADFRARYESAIDETESRITTAKTDAMKDMQKIAASLAAQAAEKIAGIPADETQAENVVRSISDKARKAA